METMITKKIGYLMVAGAVALIIPYTILTNSFDYPAVLRQETGTILTRFQHGGSYLIWTWFAFAVTGLPLIPAYILIGQLMRNKDQLMQTATTIGVTGLIMQLVGLLRWTFVVPVLANEFVNTTDPATKTAIIIAFKTIHQFAGVLLGEHLGQLFTIIWTVMLCVSFSREQLFPKWVNIFGIISAAIYLLAQADLFNTIMPGLAVWKMAGFIGSTLWLFWLCITGICFIRYSYDGKS